MYENYLDADTTPGKFHCKGLKFRKFARLKKEKQIEKLAKTLTLRSAAASSLLLNISS